MEGQLALTMFIVVCGILLLGFPVALTLGGGYANPIEASVEAYAGTYRIAAELSAR